MIGDFLKLASGLADMAPYKDRVVGRTAVKGLIVSTAYTSDMGFETAILSKDKTNIVERYGSKTEAVEGHARWCKKARTLRRVVDVGYGGLVERETRTVRRFSEAEAKEMEVIKE